MNNETFFVVWQPESGNPQYRHETYQQAKAEAERLADIAPRRDFYVLQAVSKSAKVSVVTTTLGSEELPF
jgi:hypothetical protein